MVDLEWGLFSGVNAEYDNLPSNGYHPVKKEGAIPLADRMLHTDRVCSRRRVCRAIAGLASDL
ncbi:hypothetical protein ACFP2T_31320 [Plantactinospora solaniradicis]|uniref:Uncharacterized protein n=1 Tax=Plantactinospora solaniradicis TaxID=1723736 RepID=A0ABW1KG06_9ACTN